MSNEHILEEVSTRKRRPILRVPAICSAWRAFSQVDADLDVQLLG
jgi:hypothetical protein